MHYEAMPAGREPAGDQRLAVVPVAVGRVLFDPPHLSVDEVVDFLDLAKRQARSRDPGDPVRKHRLAVEGGPDGERAGSAGRGGRDSDRDGGEETNRE